MVYKKPFGKISEEFEHYYKNSQILPERRFMAAMLERAILDYVTYDKISNTNTWQKGIYENDAKRWFYADHSSESPCYFLSFSHICDELQFDRKKILKHLEFARQSLIDGFIDRFGEYQRSSQTLKRLDKQRESGSQWRNYDKEKKVT